MIELTIISLLLLNLFQFIYWSREVHLLIDKLMSRSYAEYVSVQKKPDVSLPTPKLEMDLGPDEDLDMLNRQLAGFSG